MISDRLDCTGDIGPIESKGFHRQVVEELPSAGLLLYGCYLTASTVWVISDPLYRRASIGRFSVARVIWDRFHPTGGDIGPVRLRGYHRPTVLKGFAPSPLVDCWFPILLSGLFVSVSRQSNVWFGDSAMSNIVAVDGFEHGCENMQPYLNRSIGGKLCSHLK